MNDNALLIGVSACCLISLATQVPSIMSHQARQAKIAESQSEKVLQGDLLAAEQAAKLAQVEIANDRYDSGVEIITDLNQAGVASTIVEGDPIVAGAYSKLNRGKTFSQINPSHFLGRDVVVGDCYGTTAIMKLDPKKGYATAQSIAVTNDRDRMAKACNARSVKRPNLVK